MRFSGRPWKTAILGMIGCSVLFMVVYNFCNWYTTKRSDVGTWAFDWETHIPFLPIMVVPYWSLDLFFLGAFFVCRSVSEQKLLASRLALAICVAGACFLLFPLTLVFPRPEVDGFLGLWFAALRSFDQPHNLAPSLHIALRTILWPIYVTATTGLWNLALRGWFILIGFSTLFTYQHQVMDVVTGWILAVTCLYVLAPPSENFDTTRRVRNGRIGAMFAIAAVFLLVATVIAWPWGALFIWPATACGLAALGYLWLGPQLFDKSNGRLPLGTQLLFAPVLVGEYASLVWYSRQCRAWDEAAPGVWIGRRLNTREALDARKQGVKAVVDLTAEFTESAPFRGAKYLNLPILDLTAPTMEQLRQAVSFIDDERKRGTVYVHCKIGYSRSAAVVGAYLLHVGTVDSVDAALARLRQARPSIVVRPEARIALEAFAAEQRAMRANARYSGESVPT